MPNSPLDLGIARLSVLALLALAPAAGCGLGEDSIGVGKGRDRGGHGDMDASTSLDGAPRDGALGDGAAPRDGSTDGAIVLPDGRVIDPVGDDEDGGGPMELDPRHCTL